MLYRHTFIFFNLFHYYFICRIYSVVVECPLRVRETLKMVLTAFLCDATHINEFDLGK